MELLSVIGLLLDYPSVTLSQHRAEIEKIVTDADIDTPQKEGVLSFINNHLDKELMEWQSEYDSQFERGRSVALWLFEHVHGESRDRGQAMVDLVAQYREAGLEISQHELPDYIPLFLEFLSTQGRDNAASWLLDVEHILGLLQCRLEKRDSDYAILFEVLLKVANSELDLDVIRKKIADEKRDDSKQAIDKEWEEEEVTFGAESLEKSCETAARKPSEDQRRDLDAPLHWVGFNNADNSPLSDGVERIVK